MSLNIDYSKNESSVFLSVTKYDEATYRTDLPPFIWNGNNCLQYTSIIVPIFLWKQIPSDFSFPLDFYHSPVEVSEDKA